MIVGRLCISYDRGLKRNKAEDVGLTVAPEKTTDGGVVRGLGTHFKSEEDMERVKECEKVEYQIRKSVKERFLTSPLPGLFVLPSRNAGATLLNQLSWELQEEIRRLQIECRFVVYTLSTTDDVPSAEIREWEDRIKKQLKVAPLGRAKEAKAEGLQILRRLANCPILSTETRENLISMIEDARLGVTDRIEFKRQIEEVEITVDVGSVVEPRRPAPVTPEVGGAMETVFDRFRPTE